VSPLDWLLWVGLPYACIAIFVAGHVWRYRKDRFEWTDEWMMLLKPRALRWGIVAFHVGVFAVLGGHLLGILVPRRTAELVGLGEATYRWLAIIAGGIFGLSMSVGIGAFLWRRTRVRGVAANNRAGDLPVLVLLAMVIGLGMLETLLVNLGSGGYDYRSTVAVWFRSLFVLVPRADLMVHAPLLYQLHAIAAWLLFAVWPFSRLVHVWYLPSYAAKRMRAARDGRSGRLRQDLG
jgi:nitrate reductase gamma subunit